MKKAKQKVQTYTKKKYNKKKTVHKTIPAMSHQIAFAKQKHIHTKQKIGAIRKHQFVNGTYNEVQNVCLTKITFSIVKNGLTKQNKIKTFKSIQQNNNKIHCKAKRKKRKDQFLCIVFEKGTCVKKWNLSTDKLYYTKTKNKCNRTDQLLKNQQHKKQNKMK